MASPMVPTVRLPLVDGSENLSPEGVILELPPGGKFSISRPLDTRRTITPTASARTSLSFAGNDSDSSEGDSGTERKDSAKAFENEDPTTRVQSPVQTRLPNFGRSPPQPRLSRTLSMPLPSQLGYLKHPHRSDPLTPLDESQSSFPVTPSLSRIKEMSIELADTVQIMIQTMLRISPPQLLDPAKEQLSACTLPIPASCMSAMLMSMKNLNYISANMAGFSLSLSQSSNNPDENISPIGAPPVLTDFDIGESLQDVGDSLSGAAAQAGVDLVIYHGDDIGLKHTSVKGDESGISYALSHVVQQVLATALSGDSIELGLFVGPPDSKNGVQTFSGEDTLPIESEVPLSCTIRISHKFGSTFASIGPRCKPPVSRPRPAFSTMLLRQLLRQIRATLTPDLPPPSFFPDGRTCDFTLSLDRGLSDFKTPVASPDLEDDFISGEPSIEQLTLFAEGLKGKLVTLYANTKGSFARHLTSYLTAWGMDVTHVSPDGEVDGLPVSSPPTTLLMPSPSGTPTYKAESSPVTTTFKDQPSFMFIDDNIEVLKDRLHELHERPYSHLRKRPSIASYHRRSSQVNRVKGSHMSPSTSSAVLIHFTSIENYKVVKDVTQSVIALYAGTNAPLPEVMIILKPAGPRRFLTALYMAVTKPVVDPFFSPIATSPSSPGVSPNSYFHGYYNADSPSSRISPKLGRPAGTRTNSDRSSKSMKELADINTTLLPPPSPLSISDNMEIEYFSEASVKLGASPSSGLVIQSPDGQPAGILFHPRAKSPRNPSGYSMERDKGQLYVPDQRRRVSRVPSNEHANSVSFSVLHTIAASSSKSPGEGWSGSPPAARTSRMSPTDSSTPVASGSSPRKPTPPVPASPSSTSPVRKTPRRPTIQENNSLTPSNAMAAANKRAKAASEANIVPPISVLIVDDNPINQTILSTFMKKKNIKYDLANNGQEAVQKWRSGDFHLILMDIQMPVLDGIQATKEIRRLERANAQAGYSPETPPIDDRRSPVHTPSDTSVDTKVSASPYRPSVIIVALTASSLQSDRIAALAAGCNDFLTKPVSLIWLNSKIIEWGSLKALQMYSRRPSSDAKSLSSEQAAQARNIADRLHAPQGRSTSSPSRNAPVSAPTRRTPPPVNVPLHGRAFGDSPTATLGKGNGLLVTSTSFWDQEKTGGGSYWTPIGDPPSSPSDPRTSDEVKG